MRLSSAAAAALVAAVVGGGPLSAQDPLVYRACLSQCREFKDRGCCHEVCSYNACIAHNTKASRGHGTSRGAIRTDETDPGAWSAAMAACQPWIEILKDCHAGTPGTPPAAQATPTPTPAPTPPPLDGRLALRRVGDPKPTPPGGSWVTVASGRMVLRGYGYDGSYQWSEPPVEIGENGAAITLEVTARCSQGQRLATGLTVSGGLGLVAGDQAPAGRIDFPANCDASPGGPGPSEARAGASVRLLPPKGAARGSKFSVTFGAFWGASVEYWYEVVGP
jgi:hypothetical protein